MNAVISVAQYKNLEQLSGFVDYLAACKTESFDKITLVVVNTDGLEWDTYCFFDNNISLVIKTIEDKPREYASVMLEKIEKSAPYCDENTIFFNCDPDYAINPYALEFAHMMMVDYPTIDYLSLLRGPGGGSPLLPRFELNDFVFIAASSCMGGSMIARWSSFYPIVQKFFEKFGVTGTDSGGGGCFDQAFWHFLIEKIEHLLRRIVHSHHVNHC